MYHDHFGLHCNPFRPVPSTEFFFASRSHREALAALQWGLSDPTGLVLLSGDVGTGKTTVIRELFSRETGQVRTALVSNPRFPFEHLLESILQQLKEVVPEGRARMLEALTQAAERQRVVVVIDEAQQLSDEGLEEFRLLSNSNPERLQLMLAGQPELLERLSSPTLRQLNQRIAIRTVLSPFGHAETVDYLQHRIRAAGGDAKQIFTWRALRTVARASQGIPRRVNILSHNAMLFAYSAGSKRVRSKHVFAAAHESDQSRIPVASLPPQQESKLLQTPEAKQESDLLKTPLAEQESILVAALLPAPTSIPVATPLPKPESTRITTPLPNHEDVVLTTALPQPAKNLVTTTAADRESVPIAIPVPQPGGRIWRRGLAPATLLLVGIAVGLGYRGLSSSEAMGYRSTAAALVHHLPVDTLFDQPTFASTTNYHLEESVTKMAAPLPSVRLAPVPLTHSTVKVAAHLSATPETVEKSARLEEHDDQTATPGEQDSSLPTSVSAGQSGEVVVQFGDTLSGIAEEYGDPPGRLDVQQLIAANPDIKDANLIYPGEKIRLTTNEGTPGGAQ